MGLLSFLSKRSGDKAKSKSRSDDAAPARTLPLKTSKPATNDSTPAAEEASKRRSRVSRKPYLVNPVPTTVAAEAPAPAPAVPLFREESPERPSTAPGGSQSSTVWAGAGASLRKNPLRGAPPVSFRMFRPSPANPAARPVSHAGVGSLSTGVFPPTRTHSRSNSMSNPTRSDGTKAYKDLLDAQSEIKPADFKSRVKASGARDYGEDVADRNLGENGFNLESSHVQAFYAQLANTSQHFGHHGPPIPRDPTWVASASNKAKALNSSSSFAPPRKTAAHVPLVPRIRPPESFTLANSTSPLLRRRQSTNTYLPGTMFGQESDPSSERSTGHRTTSHPTRHVACPEDEKLPRDLPNLSSLGLSSPIAMERPKTARPASVRSPLLARDSIGLAKQRAGTPVPDHIVDDAMASHGHPSERVLSLRSSPRSRRGSVTSPTASPRKRHSLHALQRSASLSIHDPTSDPTPLSYPPHKSLQNVKQRVSEQSSVASLSGSLTIDFDVASSTKPVDPARPYYLKSPFTIHEIREVAETEPELDPSRGHNLDDSPGQATLRTRSLRASSTSSTTPTASDTSSNPFQRPQSRHTANTSVDLSVPSLKMVPSHASLDNGTAVSPETPKPSKFNMDDYISSDDDTCMEPHRPRGECEEGLLFSENGYGAGGFQLPGLLDTVPLSSSPKAKQLLQHARSSISLPPFYDCDSFGRAGARRFILDTAAHSDDDEKEHHQSGKNTSPLRGMRGTKRLSAICSSPLKQLQAGYAHEVIVEERTGKVDVSAAVKLRKEAKAQKRASGVPSTWPREARSAISLGLVDGLAAPPDDEANHADVE